MEFERKNLFNLKLSAPGKVILFGEYSVVFNKPAIAAALSLYTKLHLTENNDNILHLSFSALKLEKSFSLEDVKNYIKINETTSWEDYVKLLGKAVEDLHKKTYNNNNDLTDAQKFSLIAFFHCFWKLQNYSNGFNLQIDSELPVGSGVGSSASFSVVISAAVLLYDCFIKGEKLQRNDQNSIIIPEVLKQQICDMAFTCEKIFHGSPSGVDNNTILRGFILEFIRTDDGNKMSHIETVPFKILLVNTNVPRSTKRLVDSVKELKRKHPEVIDGVLNAMGGIAKSAIKLFIDSKSSNEKSDAWEMHLAELISLNHNLLRVLGVSHPSLENMVSIANKHNLKAKLTGAGGGGFGFIYLPSNLDSSIIRTIEEELSFAGLTASNVTLGGPGLTIEEISY